MEINFFKPTTLRGRLQKSNCDYDVFLSFYKRGKDRKESHIDINFKHFIRKNKLAWKYIRIGILNGDIIVMEGNQDNGYYLSDHNKSVSNKLLSIEIIKFLDYRIPKNPDEQIKIDFKVEKINNYYKLIKI